MWVSVFMWVFCVFVFNMRVVVKFGGSLLRGGSDFLRIGREVCRLLSEGLEVVVVVSAVKGVTDMLEVLSRPVDRWQDMVLQLRELHEKIIRELGLSSTLEKEVIAKVNSLFEELYRTVEAINVLKETSPRIRDLVLSFGERLSVILMWAALTKLGVECIHLTGREAGIITNERYGEAKPIYDLSRKMVNENLLKYLKNGITPVVTGFIAGTIDGKITTLGRGGSDYTATLLAYLIDADEVILYTDVPGIMTGDPKFVKNARVVPELSYEEAIMSAQLGAKRLHPRTFEPVRDTDIRTVITSIGASERTIIQRELKDPPLKMTAVSTGDVLLRARVPEETFHDFLMELSLGLSKLGIEDVRYMTYSDYESQLYIIVRGRALDHTLKLISGLQSKRLIEEAKMYKDIAIVSVIGHGSRDPSLLAPYLEKLKDTPTLATIQMKNAFAVVVPSDKAATVMYRFHEELLKQWEKR